MKTELNCANGPAHTGLWMKLVGTPGTEYGQTQMHSQTAS